MNDEYQLAPLISRAVDRDQLAMETLLGRIRPYLHLLARQQLESPQPAQAEHSDVVQQTLLRVHHGLESPGAQFRGDTPQQFLAWICQIQQRVILDFHRRGKARKRDLQRMAGTFTSQVESSTGPDDEIQRLERATRLASALEDLPEPQREIVERRIFDQLPYREISERTGKPEAALRMTFARAIASLRKHAGLRALLENTP